MVIHPREHDLVIGTFGRAVWVLDDIRPLRALAAGGKKLLGSNLEAFEAPEAYLVSTKNLPGYYFFGDAMYRERQAAWRNDYLVHQCNSGKVTAEILDEGGTVVKTMELDAEKGFNRFVWRLDRNPLPQVEYPSAQPVQQDRR
jgi:hypothetical protein